MNTWHTFYIKQLSKMTWVFSEVYILYGSRLSIFAHFTFFKMPLRSTSFQQLLYWISFGYSQKNSIFRKKSPVYKLFLEEISACTAVHMRYIMDACDHVIHNSFASYGGISFMLVALKRLNVSEPEDWVTWAHRTGVNCPFLRGKRIQYFSVSV